MTTECGLCFFVIPNLFRDLDCAPKQCSFQTPLWKVFFYFIALYSLLHSVSLQRRNRFLHSLLHELSDRSEPFFGQGLESKHQCRLGIGGPH